MKVELTDLEKIILGSWIISILISHRLIGFILFLGALAVAIFKLEDYIIGIFQGGDDIEIIGPEQEKKKEPESKAPDPEDTEDLLKTLVRDMHEEKEREE